METGPDTMSTNQPAAIRTDAADGTEVTASGTAAVCRSPLGTFAECPMCGGSLFPEHAHFRCSGCGWRDSCCD